MHVPETFVAVVGSVLLLPSIVLVIRGESLCCCSSVKSGGVSQLIPS